MGEDPGTRGATVSGTQDPEQIKERIEATREELGDTVEALAAKTDVKAQTRRKIADAKARMATRKEALLGKAKESSPDTALSAASGVSQKARENPLPVAVAGAFVLGYAAGRLTKD